MELNKDDYCDECWLIVSGENQEIRSTNPPESTSSVVSHNIPSVSFKSALKSPQSISTTKSGDVASEKIISQLATDKGHTPSFEKKTPKSYTTLTIVTGTTESHKSNWSKLSSARNTSRESGVTGQVLSVESQFLEGAKPRDSDLCLECLVKEHRYGFDRNLLKNVFGSGTDSHECRMITVPKRSKGKYMQVCSDVECPKFDFWKIVDSGGAGWKVDTSFEGSFPPPADLNVLSCFTTASGLCSKEQLVELSQVGLSPRVMDEVRPEIEVSEWFCGRWDSTSRYGFKVSLLDSQQLMKYVYGECITLKGPEGPRWHKVSFTFRDYEPGVRYVLFHHGGQGEFVRRRSLEGEGHPGSKMAGASVVAKRPTGHNIVGFATSTSNL